MDQKLIISVVARSRPAVYGMRLGKHPAEADDQTPAQGELVGGLIGIDRAAIVVVIIKGSAGRPDRREELGFQLIPTRGEI